MAGSKWCALAIVCGLAACGGTDDDKPAADENVDDDCNSGCDDWFPECVPEWTGCNATHGIVIGREEPGEPIQALHPAPDEGATLVLGHPESRDAVMLRLSDDGDVLWESEASLGVLASATAQSGAMLLSGVSGPSGAPYTVELMTFDASGELDWSRSEVEATELVHADCSFVAHDPELGWLVVCAVSGEFGGNGEHVLHRYDDAGALIDSVSLGGLRPARMVAAGDGRLIVVTHATETYPQSLLSIEAATGLVNWDLELESAWNSEIHLAVHPNGTLGVLVGGSLLGFDRDGTMLWDTPVSGEAECNLGGLGPIAATVDGFVTATGESFPSVSYVHHIASTGVPSCNDALATPVDAASTKQDRWIAPAGEGAWIAGAGFIAASEEGTLWLTRTTTP